MTIRLLGVGMAAYLDCDEPLPLSPGHPSAHAGFQLAVDVEDGIVQAADVRPGLMHRSAEKLYESRDYRQIMMLANRQDWLSPLASELGIALAIEAATGITPPERATWIRMLLAEANRVAATLAFVAAVAPEPALRADLLAAREQLAGLQEQVTGTRVHPMFVRIGGVAAPIDPDVLTGWGAAIDALSRLPGQCAEVAALLRDRSQGIGVLTRETAIDVGASGAVARASGLDLDLRRDDPYLAYPDLADLLTVPTATEGDASARYDVLVRQVPVSLRLMSACVDRLATMGDGPVDVLLPKVVKVPEGMTQSWLEGPLGISGCLLVSAGERTPWRLKIRSASFSNARAMQAALPGTPVDQLAEAVMSFFFVVGDIDR